MVGDIDRIMTEVFVFRVAHPERPRVHLIVLLGPDFQVSFAEASSKNANFYRDARLREVSFRDQGQIVSAGHGRQEAEEGEVRGHC